MGEPRTPFDPPRPRNWCWWGLAAIWDFSMGALIGAGAALGDWLLVGTSPWTKGSLWGSAALAVAFGLIFLVRRSHD